MSSLSCNRMFPTLGLFASVRCPELSTSTPGGVCRRQPCLFSHTVAQPRTFAVSKRSADVASTTKSAFDAESDKPAKKAKVASESSGYGLFSAQDDDVKPGRKDTERAGTQTTPGPSNAVATQTAPLKGASSLRKATFSIGRDGKVVRKGPPAALRPPPALASSFSTSSTIKGKQRAPDQTAATAPTYTASSIGPPRLPLNTKNSYFPIATRNAMLKNIFQEFMTLYAAIEPRNRGQRLAGEHALKQESTIYNKNNKFSYRNACIQAIARLKKRVPALDASDTGTLEDYDQRLKEEAEASRSHLTVKKASRLTMDRAAMLAQDFVVDLPPGKGGNIPTEEGGTKKCERCGTDFIVHGAMSEIEARACTHHWGRLETTSDKTRRWSCCQHPFGGPGCVQAGHVFIEKQAEQLHSRVAFVPTSGLLCPSGKTPLKIAALDCEMVYTTAGMSLARLTILDAEGDQVFDEFIKPNGMVLDLITRWSGVTERDLDVKAKMDNRKLRREVLGGFIDVNTILIGHGLENDLKALRLVHPPGRVIDTINLFPHIRGLPYRPSLRNLARDHLKIFIQDRGAAGHSSIVDAKAALDLVKLKASSMT